MTEQPRKHDKTRRETERELDKALEQSFPASDPPAMIQPTPEHDERSEKNRRAKRKTGTSGR